MATDKEIKFYAEQSLPADLDSSKDGLYFIANKKGEPTSYGDFDLFLVVNGLAVDLNAVKQGVLDQVENELDAKIALRALGEEVYRKYETYSKTEVDLKSFGAFLPIPIKPTDPAPTAPGIYRPTVSGPYPNLGGLVVDMNGKLNEVLFDGATIANVVTPLPAVDTSNLATKEDLENATLNIPLTNEALNSNFANGDQYWSLETGSTTTVANNTLINTGDGTKDTPEVVRGGIQQPFNAGEKIYIRARMRVTNPDAVRLALTLTQTAQTSSFGVFLADPVQNQWYDLNRITTITTAGGSAGLTLGHRYLDAATALGKVMEVQHVVAINLTKAYGAGNEPDLATVNSILDKFTNRWFAGKVDTYPTSEIIQNQINSEAKIAELEKLNRNVLVNKFKNGDFSDTSAWARISGNQSVLTYNHQNKTLNVKPPLGSYLGFQQLIGQPAAGDRFYFAIQHAEHGLKPSTSNIYLRLGVPTTSLDGNFTEATGLDEFKFSSKIFSIPSTPTADIALTYRSNYPSGSDLTNVSQTFKYALLINLTEVFGAGNEPSQAYMDQIIKRQPNMWIDGQASLADVAVFGVDKFRLEIESVPYNDPSNISRVNAVYPVLFGVKNITKLGEQTKPTGWLYYTPYAPYDILYASGTPDNPKKLFSWNVAVTIHPDAPTGLSPDYYSPIICRNGDVIFVYRGERSAGTVPTEPRRNPIIYKAGNYGNPQVIDFGASFKPHAWLQNCGMEVLPDGTIMFAEYTRPTSTSANIWKVVAPYDNPASWTRVMTQPLGSANGGVEHFHTINYDPYSNSAYSTTGDLDAESNIFETRDIGASWLTRTTGSAIVSRVLNFIIRPEGLYWGTDDGRHIFWFAPRGEDTFIDFSARKVLYDFRYQGTTQVTYATCLVNDPEGILFLDRHDGLTTNHLNVWFWDLKKQEMHVIDVLQPLNGVEARYGFRNDAVSFYPSISSDKVVVGFGYHPNDIEVLNNESGAQENRVCNLTLEVKRA